MKHTAIILFILNHTIFSIAQNKPGTDKNATNTNTIIMGILEGTKEGDSLSLFLYDENVLSDYEIDYVPVEVKTSAIKSKFFSFTINDVKDIKWFCLAKNAGTLLEKKVTDYLLLEKGDNIEINITNNKVLFYGKGSEKLRCIYTLDSISKGVITNSLYEKEGNPTMQTKSKDYVKHFYFYDSLMRNQLNFMKSNYPNLSPLASQIITAEIIGRNQYRPVYYPSFSYDPDADLGPKTDFDTIRQYLAKKYLNEYIVSDRAASLSMQYLKYSFEKAKLEKWISMDSKSFYDKTNSNRFWFISKKEFGPKVFEKLATINVILAYKYFSKPDSLINEVLGVVQNKVCKAIIANIHDRKKVGVPFNFDFSFENSEGNRVSLKDFKGKVIFLDFWYVGCTSCVAYFKGAVSKAEEIFRNNPNVAFISICAGNDKDAWLKAVNRSIYTSKEAINLFTGISGFDHPLVKYYSINSAPTPFLIGKDGKFFCTQSIKMGHGDGEKVDKLVEQIEIALKQ